MWPRPASRALRGTPALFALLALLSCAGTADDAVPGAPASGRNRLDQEISPYLQQHASNPVNWFPWGEDALRVAKEEDKPIFLSIGYSTCYWCHVMEEESFTDEEVAAVLNEHFVAIKVDREERPDLDEIYMTAVQMLTGRGGWPMSTWLTPDGRPFHGGTYFPRERFLATLRQIHTAWVTDRARLLEVAERVSVAIRTRQRSAGARSAPPVEAVDAGVRSLGRRFDARSGGFGSRPKFPNESGILLLLDDYRRSGSRESLRMALASLDGMARGGIRDHLGGGFHRYSVDDRWIVPHFEKMLYNQAWLGRAYLEAWEITGEERYREIVRELLAYVARDMTSPRGTFYSAEDAGAVDHEGEFYVFGPEEIRSLLGPEDGALFLDWFGITEEGNFEHGKSVLHLPHTLQSFADAHGLSPEQALARLSVLKRRVGAARSGRDRPFRDEKVLTGWNGMMIGTFARAARVLEDRDLADVAARAARGLLRANRRDDALLRASRDGKPGAALGFQEDYAWFVDGLLELYDATGEDTWLGEARNWTDRMVLLFWDADGGGFTQTSARHASLLATSKDPYDGAVPSGNSVAAFDLVRLAARSGDASYRSRAEQTLAAFSPALMQAPGGHAFLLRALDALHRGEEGALEYGSRGALRAQGRADAKGRLTVALSVRPGWHVNANPAAMDTLIPTEVRVRGVGSEERLQDVRYPEGERKKLSFSGDPLLLWQGTVKILAALESPRVSLGRRLVHVEVRHQACDDSRCLPPETLTLEIPLPR